MGQVIVFIGIDCQLQYVLFHLRDCDGAILIRLLYGSNSTCLLVCLATVPQLHESPPPPQIPS